MDILKAFETLKKLENKVQALYEFYNRLFCDDREVAGVFYELALEEKSHADMIDYQIRMVRKNRSIFKEVEIDLTAVEAMIARIDALLCAEEPISLTEALKLAIELEAGALEYHYRTLIAKSNPEVGPLIRALGASDKEHADMLRDLAVKRSVNMDEAPEAPEVGATSKEALKPYQVKLVSQLIEVEQLVAELYTEFIGQFPAHEALWAELAAQEREHAAAVLELKEKVLAGEAIFDEGRTRTYTVSSMIDYVRGVLGRARRGELDIKQAVSLSLDIEKSMIEKDAHSYFTGLTPELVSSVRRLRIETGGHFETLKTLMGKL